MALFLLLSTNVQRRILRRLRLFVFFSYFLSFFPSAFAYTYHIHIRFCIDADVRRQRVPKPAAALLTATGAIERVATHCTYCAFVRTFIE